MCPTPDGTMGRGQGPHPSRNSRASGARRGASSSPQNTVGLGNGARLGAPGVRSFLTPALNPRGTCEAAEGSRRRLPRPVWLLSQTRDSAGTQRPPGGPPAASPLPQGGWLPAPSASSPCPCHSHRPRQGAACLGGPPEDRAAFKGDSEATGRACAAHKAGMRPTARSPLGSRGASAACSVTTTQLPGNILLAFPVEASGHCGGQALQGVP